MGAFASVLGVNLVGAAEQAFCGKFCTGRGDVPAAIHVDPAGALRVFFAHAQVGNGGAVDDEAGAELPEQGVYIFRVRNVKSGVGGGADVVFPGVKVGGPAAEKAGGACDQ